MVQLTLYRQSLSECCNSQQRDKLKKLVDRVIEETEEFDKDTENSYNPTNYTIIKQAFNDPKQKQILLDLIKKSMELKPVE